MQCILGLQCSFSCIKSYKTASCREREAGTNNGWEKETKSIKNSARTNSRCNARTAAEEKRDQMDESMFSIYHMLDTCDRIFLAPTD